MQRLRRALVSLVDLWSEQAAAERQPEQPPVSAPRALAGSRRACRSAAAPSACSTSRTAPRRRCASALALRSAPSATRRAGSAAPARPRARAAARRCARSRRRAGRPARGRATRPTTAAQRQLPLVHAHVHVRHHVQRGANAWRSFGVADRSVCINSRSLVAARLRSVARVRFTHRERTRPEP